MIELERSQQVNKACLASMYYITMDVSAIHLPFVIFFWIISSPIIVNMFSYMAVI